MAAILILGSPWEANAMMGYDWGVGWGWMGIVGMLFMLLFWVVIVAAAVWLGRELSRPREMSGEPRGADVASAQRILEERLARGEIDVEEFRTRRAAILEHR